MVSSRKQNFGVSLIELLVAITIGAILIFGATQVYVDSRNMYEVNETTARLQETARYAMAVIEPDVRMANYWGLVKGAALITDQAAQTAASAGQPVRCGVNYARDLMLNLDGRNNSFGRNETLTFPAALCGAFQSRPVASADTLTVRRASVGTTVATANTLQICSNRVQGRLFSDGSACTPAPAGQVNDLVVHTYYVARDSKQADDLPALRRKFLIAGPGMDDDEIIAGVEDLQIQFGVDPKGTSGTATRYMDPETLPLGTQVVAVRIWLLVRTETPEVGFTDGRTYEYADRISEENGNCNTDDLSDAGAATCAYVPADGFRRLLVSRTIQIRNALGT
jgi:type IV pilus assembly protein PilW